MNKIRQAINRNGIWGIFAILVYRFGHLIYCRLHLPFVRQLMLVLYLLLDLIVKVVTGAEFSPDGIIEKNVSFVHNANGVMLGGRYKIGEGTVIYHQVTIGVINGKSQGPQIGKNVFIGAGAKILGPVIIGDNAKIGANAVVISDVPERATAVGIPARIVLN